LHTIQGLAVPTNCREREREGERERGSIGRGREREIVRNDSMTEIVGMRKVFSRN